MLEQKIDAAVSCPDTKEPWKVWGKTNSWFPILPKKNWVNFLRAGKKVKISNLIGWFCLKDKLLEQNVDTAVSCPDTKEPWKVWGKTDSWFPILPPKSWVNFIRPGKKVKISNLNGWFCLKDKLLEQNVDTAVSCPDTEGPWKVWGKTNFWFPIQAPKNWLNFLRAGKKVEISNLISWFCLKPNSLNKKLTQ